MTESLCVSPETITTLLIDYTLIQNKKLKEKRRHFAGVTELRILGWGDQLGYPYGPQMSSRVSLKEEGGVRPDTERNKKLRQNATLLTLKMDKGAKKCSFWKQEKMRKEFSPKASGGRKTLILTQ